MKECEFVHVFTKMLVQHLKSIVKPSVHTEVHTHLYSDDITHFVRDDERWGEELTKDATTLKIAHFLQKMGCPEWDSGLMTHHRLSMCSANLATKAVQGLNCTTKYKARQSHL